MPINLGIPYKPDWKGWPPGYIRDDIEIWRRYQQQAEQLYSAVYFQVRLGGTAATAAREADNLAQAWAQLTAKRIDMVGEKADGWDVIEFRMDAGPSSLGQIQIYKTMWQKDPPDARPVRYMIITDRSDRDIAEAAKELGIEMVVV